MAREAHFTEKAVKGVPRQQNTQMGADEELSVSA
jgi:hypothetical protein